jgi:hypothetical protein
LSLFSEAFVVGVSGIGSLVWTVGTSADSLAMSFRKRRRLQESSDGSSSEHER